MMKEEEIFKVYIIILNYNGWADTIECLESILRNDYTNYQVIVVDNNSPNNSMKYIKAWAEGKLDVWVKPDLPLRYLSFPSVEKPISYIYYDREEAEKVENSDLEESLKNKIPKGVTTKHPLIFIQTGKNLGFAGGNNIAIKYILNKEKNKKESYLWFLNPDMVMGKNSLKNFVLNCRNNKNNLIYGTKVNSYYEPNKTLFVGGAKLYKFIGIIRFVKDEKKLNCIDYISGGSLIVNLKNLEKIGLLPEDYFLYWEDADWCFLAKSKGYNFAVCNNVLVFDKGGSSIGRNSEQGYFFYLRNYIIFYKKYLRRGLISDIIIFLFYILRFLKAIVKGDKELLKAFLRLVSNLVK